MMKYICKAIGKQEGQAMVEMAMVLPILLLLFMGIFEVGRIMGAYMIISDLARDGVRHGVVGYSDQQIVELINNQRIWLDADRMDIDINAITGERRRGEPLEVTVRYSLPLVAPFISAIIPNPFPLESRCYMRIE
ncbi:MAG: pilus assembly protein [Syntrophomonadaceae bacterium]|nr:pilus assembly protein [Syntrophomonadaceae bacterium]